MPTIKLTDQLGVDVDAQINPDSTIAKYIKDLSKLKFPRLNFEELKNVTLDQSPVKATFGLRTRKDILARPR